MAEKKMSAIGVLPGFVLLTVLGGANAQAIEVTVETVDQYGTPREGQVTVEGNFGTAGGDSPLTYEQADGAHAYIRGGWHAGLAGFGAVIWEDTTYTFDVRTQGLTIESTPGVTRVYIVFEAIDVTIATVDREGNLLDGKVWVQNSAGMGKILRITGDSPLTYEQANGGQAYGGNSFHGGWRSGETGCGTIIWKDTTYNFDALTGELTIVSTPGETRVNIIFEPIDVTIATVDRDGNLLNGKVWVQNNGGMCKIYRITGDSPLTYEQANGGTGYGGTSFYGGWRAGTAGLGSVIYKDTTYNFDAVTHELTSESTPGETRVNLVFEPIEVTVTTVDQDGNPLEGNVWVQNNGGMCKIYRITGDSPLTYEQANGGGGYGGTSFHGGSNLGQTGFVTRVWKDRTYNFNALTQELTYESTPGETNVNIVFITSISATVDIDPDVLNLQSEGKWITCYVELPEGYDAAQIDVGTVLLNGVVPAETKPTGVGDYDNDGIPDLTVKFDRSAVGGILGPADEVEITVSGQVARTLFEIPFEGSDTIRVID